jgi:aspartate/methionine/tyrosine aminotransferase
VWEEFTPLARELGAVNLGQGFPDWPSPDFCKEAAKKALDDNYNQAGGWLVGWLDDGLVGRV